MRISVEINESDLRSLVLEHLQEKFNSDLKPDDVKIEVKSKQNYKSEWESASFRATVSKEV